MRPGSHPNRCPSLLLAAHSGEGGPQLGDGRFRRQIKVINLKEPSIAPGRADRGSRSSGPGFQSNIRIQDETGVRDGKAKGATNRQPCVTPTCQVATDFADIIKVAQLPTNMFMCACWEARKRWRSGATCRAGPNFPFRFPL